MLGSCCNIEGYISDAGNEVIWPMDSRLGHYCYKPEYIDDCSKLLDEEVRTFILDRKIPADPKLERV